MRRPAAGFTSLRMTSRQLFWIGADRSRHGKGVGNALLDFVEEHVARADGRGHTIRFVAPDRYGEGENKLTFPKNL